MKLLIFITLACNIALQATELVFVDDKRAITGTTTTLKKDNSKVTNIDLTLFGVERLSGSVEISDNLSSKYLWTGVTKEDVVQKGRTTYSVFLFDGPQDYPSAQVNGKLITTPKGYSAKDILFSYFDPYDDFGSKTEDRVSGFITKYGDTGKYLVSWSFKENGNDSEDSVFIGRLYGSLQVRTKTNKEGLHVVETSYDLLEDNLKKVQVTNFIKWWLS